MALRVRAQFQSERGQIWTIQIHDTEWAGSVNVMDVAPPGFTLSWAGGEDIWHPIIPSTCTVPVYINSATDDTLLEDMSGADEGRFRMVVRKGDGDNATLWWVGLITVDNIVISDEPHPQTFEIQAVDGLQLLSRVDYDNSDSNASVGGILLYCLKQIGTHDLFNTSGIDLTFLRLQTDVVPDVATYNDPFNDVNLVPGLFNPFTEEYDFDLNSEQVLTQLALCYNSRLMLCEGAFHFLPVSRPTETISANLSLRPYKADGTQTGNQTVQFVYTVNAAASDFYRLRGWERRVIAPVSAVERPLIYGEGHLLDNTNVGGATLYPSGSTAGSTSATYTFSSENTFPANTTFNINGLCEVFADYLGASTGEFQCARLKLSIMLRVGSYYLRRMIDLHPDDFISVAADEFNVATSDESVLTWEEPGNVSWSTASASRLQFGSDVLNFDGTDPDFATGQDDQTQISLDFTTPGLPVAQDMDVELTITPVLFNSNGSGANAAKLNACTTFTDLVLSAGDSLSGSTVLYRATNANNATEVRQLEPVNFGSQLVLTNVYYYNPSEFYNVNGPLSDWKSTLTTAAKELHELCVYDQAQYFDEPREIHAGALYSHDATVLPMLAHVYDGQRLKYFMIVSMTMMADTETYECEIHELNNSGAPTSTTVKPKPAKPVPAVQALDGLVKRVNRETRSTSKQFIQVTGDIADLDSTVTDLARTTDADGGDSSILLSYLGDVKISGVADGQILEYNSTAGRWANVTPTGGTDNSLSETNQTIDAGTTRKIVLDAAAGQQVYFNVTDGEDNVLESIVAYGNGIVIQEKYGALAIRSTALFQGSIALYEASGNGINSLSLKAPASVSSNKIFTLPDSYGTSGQALTTNGSGTLSWATVGGGGSSAPIPLANISGRYMYSSSDSGERMWTGQGSYGPFNWYSFTSEPGTTMRTYSASDAVGTKTGTMNHWQLMAYGVHVPTTDKKVRVDFMMRMQNAPASSTWGFSLWGANRTTTGTTTTSITTTLRGISSDVTAVDTNSTRLYHGTVETDADFTEDVVILMPESRTGTLTTTTYLLCNFQFTLVD